MPSETSDLDAPGSAPAVTPLIAAAVGQLRPCGAVLTPSTAVAAELARAGLDARCESVEAVADGEAGAIALLDDELSLAGEHAEGLVADAVRALRPGGLLAVSARSQLHQRLNPTQATVRGYGAEDLRRALGHHGIDVTLLCAPGAASIIARAPAPTYHDELDRSPGLLDVAPRLLAVGRTAQSPDARSAAFFSTLPYKVVAAGVLCRDAQDRLLVVHDSFKGHWTIPGGVVDADEDPRAAAEREAWEEAGVRVTAGEVLGVFSASWPDRVVLVYAARPTDGAEHHHEPLHAHEIDGVEWWPVAQALERLAPHIAEQVEHCLAHPGGTLRQPRA